MAQESKYDLETILAYVRGDLDDDRSQAIDRAAGEDGQLAAEIAMVKGVRSVGLADAERADPAEFGWARLSKAIDKLDDTPSDESDTDRRFALWHVAAAAGMAFLASQAMTFLTMPSVGPDAPQYVPVTDGGEGVASLRVIFLEDARQGDVRALLNEVDAKIVDGPNAIGFYTLAFSNEEARANAEARLAEAPDLVESLQID